MRNPRNVRQRILEDIDEELLKHSLNRAFHGSVEVLIPSKDGEIGAVQVTVKRIGIPGL